MQYRRVLPVGGTTNDSRRTSRSTSKRSKVQTNQQQSIARTTLLTFLSHAPHASHVSHAPHAPQPCTASRHAVQSCCVLPCVASAFSCWGVPVSCTTTHRNIINGITLRHLLQGRLILIKDYNANNSATHTLQRSVMPLTCEPGTLSGSYFSRYC